MKNQKFIKVFFITAVPLIALCFVAYKYFQNLMLFAFIPVIFIGCFVVARIITRDSDNTPKPLIALSQKQLDRQAVFDILKGSIAGVFVSYLFITIGYLLVVASIGYLEDLLPALSSILRFLLIPAIFIALWILPIHLITVGAKNWYLNGGSRFPKLVPWITSICYLLTPIVVFAVVYLVGFHIPVQQWEMIVIGIALCAGTILTFIYTKGTINELDKISSSNAG